MSKSGVDKVKVPFLAFALLLLIAPAGADELPGRGDPQAKAPALRFDTLQWLVVSDLAPQGEGAPVSAPAPMMGRGEASFGPADARAMTAVYLKIRAMALLRPKAAGSSAAGTRRIRLRCAVKYLVVKRNRSSPAVPAGMQWAASSEETVIRAAVEVCSIRVARRSRATEDATTVVPFSFTLPPLSETSH
jgi:hypothetical protein